MISPGLNRECTLSTLPETPGESMVRWAACTMPRAVIPKELSCNCRGRRVRCAVSLPPSEDSGVSGSVTMAVPIKRTVIPRPAPMDHHVPFFWGASLMNSIAGGKPPPLLGIFRFHDVGVGFRRFHSHGFNVLHQLGELGFAEVHSLQHKGLAVINVSAVGVQLEGTGGLVRI